MRSLAPCRSLALLWGGASIFFVLVGACDTEASLDKTKQAAEEVSDASKKVVDGTKETIDDTRRAVDTVKQKSSQQADRAAAFYERITDTGELSRNANAWLEARAKQEGGAIEQIIVMGTQLAPVALQVGRVLNDAIESETLIEPIYQEIEGVDGTLAVDGAIGDMPRVEVIDGLTIGIRQLDTLQADTAVKERAYLVTWRQDDHLVGFVYRSTRTIDVDRLVKELPPLVRTTSVALQASK